MTNLLMKSLLALALTSGAASAADVFVRFGPPPPPREVVIARPGPRHVWVPGYYRWAGHRYRWSNGYWAMPPRHAAVWVPGHWAPRRGGYVWIRGFWR